MAKQTASEYERKASDYVAEDLAAARQEYRFEPPAFMMGMASKLLRDPRDVPVLKMLINQLMLVIPSAVFLYTSPYAHLLGPLYFAANNILFLQRFILTLHVSEHGCLFKREYFLLNQIVPYVMCPLYGLPFAVYKLHHVIMHHVENNKAGADGSATEQFQRDNFLHFLWYWTKFWLLGWVLLPYYAFMRQRYSWVVKSVLAETAHLTMVFLLRRVNPAATLWVFIIPMFFTSFTLMFGN